MIVIFQAAVQVASDNSHAGEGPVAPGQAGAVLAEAGDCSSQGAMQQQTDVGFTSIGSIPGGMVLLIVIG